MGVKSEILGEPIDTIPLENSERIFSCATSDIHPGIVQVNNNGSGSHLVAIKHSSFRPGEDGRLDEYYPCDIVQLSRAVYDNNPGAMGPFRLQGVEAELNIVDTEGRPLDIRSAIASKAKEDKTSVPNRLEKEVSKHPELWNNTLEVDAPPRDSALTAYSGLKKVIGATSRDLQAINASIDPASARMQDIPGEQNVTNNPYVKVMVGKLGKNILKFIGLGVHEHYDVHIKHSPLVGNYLRTLAPFLNLGLHAAPFGFGETTPNLKDIFGNDELQPYDGQQPSSLRYLARANTSPNGGVGVRVAHDNIISALSHADAYMQSGEINSPARLYGNHADIRLRSDPPTPDKLDHPGRLEVCVYDTGAFRFETNVGYSLLTRAVINRLEEAVVEGRQSMQEIHKQFSNLFGNTYDMDQFARVQLDRAHENSVRIAYFGANASVLDGNGREILAREHLINIIKFANGPNENLLETNVIATLVRSVMSDDKLGTVIKDNLDHNRLPTLEGYYRTGRGTAAQWMIARATAQRDRGKTEEEIMQDNTIDRVESFKKYLGKRIPQNSSKHR